MKKSLIFIAFCALISLFGYVVAEQGDFATLGFNTPGGYSYWRVDSDGHFKPGYASTYNIGSAALPVATVYAGAISGAATVAGTAFTATGAISGATVSGTTSVTSPLYIATGAIRLYSRSKAQILALTSVAIGDAYYCNDCTAVTMCVSTAAAKGSFVKVDDKSAVCD